MEYTMCPVLLFLEHLCAQLSQLQMPRLPDKPMPDLSEQLTDVIQAPKLLKAEQTLH